MRRQNIISEFWEFAKCRKRYWLFPVAIMLFFLGLLIMLSAEGSFLSPLIYMMF